MKNAATVNQLETVIGKLIKLNHKIIGNKLQDAIREIVSVKYGVQAGELEIRKTKK